MPLTVCILCSLTLYLVEQHERRNIIKPSLCPSHFFSLYFFHFFVGGEAVRSKGYYMCKLYSIHTTLYLHGFSCYVFIYYHGDINVSSLSKIYYLPLCDIHGSYSSSSTSCSPLSLPHTICCIKPLTSPHKSFFLTSLYI